MPLNDDPDDYRNDWPPDQFVGAPCFEPSETVELAESAAERAGGWYPGAHVVSMGGNGGAITARPAENVLHIAASSWNIDPADPTNPNKGIAGWNQNARACTGYNDQHGALQQYASVWSSVSGTKDGNWRCRTWEAWNPEGLNGTAEQYNSSTYTAAQCERFSDLLAWDHIENGAVLDDMTDSRRASHGCGVHRYGIDPWRVSAGEVWTASRGKTCLPLDTDILTASGWKRLGDITDSDEVASWSLESGVVSFDRAARIEPFQSGTVVIAGIETTPDHEWIVQESVRSCSCGFVGATNKAVTVHVGHAARRGERDQHQSINTGVWKKVAASQVRKSQVIPTSVDADRGGLPLSDDQIRLAVWLQADGHFMRETRRPGEPLVIGVEWHFTKPRKVARVAALLDRLGVKYCRTQQSDSTFKLRVYGDEARTKVIPLLPTKRFDASWMEASRHQVELVWAEARQADGASTASVGKEVIFSTDVQSLGVIQAMSVLNGMEVTSWESGGLTWLLRRQKPRRATAPVEGRESVVVSCLTTVNGTLIARQNGRVVVIGNCPGSARVRQLSGIVARARVIADAVRAGRCTYLPPGRVNLTGALARTGNQPKEWDEMASKDEIRELIREEVGNLAMTVRRDGATGLDYLVAPTVFQHIPSEAHYHLLLTGGLITIPHGKAPLISADHLRWLASEVGHWGGFVQLGPLGN